MLAAAGGIALVEHQVDHAQHAIEARGELVRLGNFIGDAGVADLRLGANDALGECGGGGQERAGDFLRGEATNLAQGQRDACLIRKARMAAGEDQAQAIVLDRLLLVLAWARIGDLLDCFSVFVDAGEAGLAAKAVDCLEPANGNEPRDRIGRHAVARPLFGGCDEGVVFGFLGAFEAAEEPNEGCEDASSVAAVDSLEQGDALLAHLSFAPAKAASCAARASCVRASPKSSIS